MTHRELFTWKFVFYGLLLPRLRALGPARADALLTALGRGWSRFWPGRRRRLRNALAAARQTLHVAGWDLEEQVDRLAGGIPRYIARDYLLDTDDDAQALALFDVTGAEAFDEARRAGRGVVLVGSHFGGHLAAFHWLYRRGVPVRLMVQRPRHVAATLQRFFDTQDPEPQAGFFLSRSLDPTACVSRILRARSALRTGKTVYLPGDIPWDSPNTREGRLLGQSHRLLSVWADLAALTGAPVFFVFCTHQPGGRFALTLESFGRVANGEEQAAVTRYLTALETQISASPADAVAHLLWPCYGPPCPDPVPGLRPSRNTAVARALG